jgi:hypothetical protein
MSDDREVRCYALLIDQIKGTAPASAADDVRSNWYALRDADDGCTHAAGELYSYKKLSALDIWRKARLGAEANRSRVVRAAVEIVAPEALTQLKEVLDSPSKYLLARNMAGSRVRQELVLLALIKLASGDPTALRTSSTASGANTFLPRSATGPGASSASLLHRSSRAARTAIFPT